MNNIKTHFQSENMFFGEETIGSIPCIIGYKKEFRWTWFACQLNTFIIVGQTDQPIDVGTINQFSDACFRYALSKNQGWPRGLQSGVGSIAILCADSYNQAAAASCETLTKKHWSAFEIPIIYDRGQHKLIHYKKAPMWGSLFFPYFTEQIKKLESKLA